MRERTYHTLSYREKEEVIVTIREFLSGDDAILFAYLYGSFNETKLPFRDIDIGIYLWEGRLDRKRELDYQMDLSIALERRVSLPVDCRVLNHVPYSFLYHVIKGKLLFTRDEDFLDHLLYTTWATYQDNLPRKIQALKEVIREWK